MNSHRIHYDVDYCKTVEYYPSLVVHGPLLAQNLIDVQIRGLRVGYSFLNIEH